MTSRWRSERAALLGAALVALAAAPAAAQDESGVLDLILPVQDLTLKSTRLDGSLSTSESNKRVEVTLAADVLFRFDSASLTRPGAVAHRRGRREDRRERPAGRARHGPHRLARLRRLQPRAQPPPRRRRDAALHAELGADAPRLSTRGRGEADPVAPNAKPDGTDNPRGRARNRRVEVVFPR